MADANRGAPSGAPLARLRGIKRNQVSVIQTDFGARWIAIEFDWYDDDMERCVVALDPRDAQTLGAALLDQAAQALARSSAERN